MPRTVREKRLDSPAARAKLKHGADCWPRGRYLDANPRGRLGMGAIASDSLDGASLLGGADHADRRVPYFTPYTREPPRYERLRAERCRAQTRMTERHYAHLAPSYVAEQIRKFAPSFGTAEDSNIVPIARG
jgi:hypothetical protein